MRRSIEEFMIWATLLAAVLWAAPALAQVPAKCPHEALKELCFYCDPALREKGRLWCKEHDRYEDRCWECHAEMQDKNRTYCTQHYLYQDECFLCRPELKNVPETEDKPGSQREPETKGARPEAQSKLESQPKHGAETRPAVEANRPALAPRLMCQEHGVPEDECGICHSDLAASIQPGQALKIRFASPEAATRAGVRTAPARVGPISAAVECYAEITFNQNRLARIPAPAAGILQGIEVDLGDRVRKGAVLAEIRSASIGEAVAEALLARQTLERKRILHAEQIGSEREWQEAQAADQAAGQQLRMLGLEDGEITALGSDPSRIAVLPLRAPFAGEIVERDAVPGVLVEAGRPLFTLADRSTMWAMLDIPEAQLAQIRVGQSVELQVDAFLDRTFAGKLTWVAAQVDERTRMARARAEVPNPDGALRSQMFARGRIITGSSDRAVVIPESAVQQIEGRPFAFVKVADDLYEARPIRVGARLDGNVEVFEGLALQEPVVVAGSFLVKSQLLISRLGAGCVD